MLIKTDSKLNSVSKLTKSLLKIIAFNRFLLIQIPFEFSTFFNESNFEIAEKEIISNIMPALSIANFDLNALVYVPEPKDNTRGGKYATVGYGDAKKQVEFQLGDSPKEALRCAFGVEAPESDPNSFAFKVDITDKAKHFIQALDDATCRAAATNSPAWFKKQVDCATLKQFQNSAIKPSAKPEYPDTLKICVFKDGRKKPKVEVATWKDGKLTRPVPGTLDDVQQGVMVLPVLKIKGGVYFIKKEFGISFLAAHLLVIRDEGGAVGSSGINYGDVEMTDAEGEDPCSQEDPSQEEW